jgi:predicted permease
MFVGLNAIAPRYFETLQSKLLAGSEMSWSNREGTSKVAIVNETFAKKFYPNKDPLGQTLYLTVCSANSAPITVVGLVADSKTGMRQEMRPTMYLAVRQPPPALSFMTFLVRTNGDPAALLPTIRKAIAELDASVPIFGEATGVAVRDQIMRQERLMMVFLIIFGSIALLLSCLGIYGMLAYVVARRTPEVGIRMALGAQRAAVVRMIVRESLIPVSVGMGLGVGIAFAISRWVESMLFNVSPNDPWTIVAITVIFTLSSTAATWLPARRASRIHPMNALRYE